MMQPYIYAIKGNGMTYYGSSSQPLYERKSSHITTYKYYKKTQLLDKCCKSYLILDSCDDWIIEKVEELPIETTKEELLLRENYYIQNCDCVNKNLAVRTEEINREYKRDWAEKDRREKGIPIKGHKNSTSKEYKAEWIRNKRANLTEEEKKEHLEHRRKLHAEKEQTEDQKEAAKERAKKQRELIKADPEKLAQMKEYKKLKAREYREKKKQENI
jgi:hypothetical protein